jgi:hypothetical protein
MALFLETPLVLHRDEPCYVPLPALLEKDQLTPARNPFWRHARRELFVALRAGRPVGRIAAILDDDLDAASGQRVGAWGYFACEDDADTAEALFEAAESWHAARPEGAAAFLRGPLNPSLNYAAGMLVEGFERFPPFMNPWNPPYYPALAEACGMEKEQDLLFYRLSRAHTLAGARRDLDRDFTRKSAFSLRRSTRATYAADMGLLAELYTRCWSDNWGFTPLRAEEIRYSWSVMRCLPVVSELLFLEHGGEAVGMILFGADLGVMLKGLNGSLSPAALWRCLSGLRRIGGGRIFMLGLTPKYRRSIAVFQLLRRAVSLFTDMAAPDYYIDAGWILEDNDNMNRICERARGELLTRSRLYRRMCPNA